ncbi:MAG: YkgJ family cysteine cluster protein [Fibrobacter sp.]|nr:YkgJ family cysteine cluster protein [Fibrobacter sp.]
MTIECGRCATCCSVPVVPVSLSDVQRLCEALDVPARKIIRFYNEIEMEFDPEADLWVRLKSGKLAMGLRKRNSRCIFLNKNNLCSVYRCRPMTCRTFPYIVEFDDDDNVCKVSLNKIVDCKCVRKIRSALESVINDVRMELSEDDFYYDKVLEWNSSRAGGTIDEFLKFIGLTF